MGDFSIYTKLNWNGNSVIQLPWACHPLWSTTPQRWSSLGVLYAPVSNPSTMLFKLPKLIGLPRWTWVESLLWAVISVLSGVNRHLYTSLPRTVSTESHGCFWELQATQPPPTSSQPGRVPQVREDASSMLSGSSPLFFMTHYLVCPKHMFYYMRKKNFGWIAWIMKAQSSSFQGLLNSASFTVL